MRGCLCKRVNMRAPLYMQVSGDCVHMCVHSCVRVCSCTYACTYIHVQARGEASSNPLSFRLPRRHETTNKQSALVHRNLRGPEVCLSPELLKKSFIQIINSSLSLFPVPNTIRSQKVLYTCKAKIKIYILHRGHYALQPTRRVKE